MKKLIVAILAVSSFSVLAQTPGGDLGLSPSSLKLKVYKFAVSTSVDCSNPITVIDNGNTAVEADFTSAPNLGAGSVPDGTYPCIIIEVSDNIKYTPDALSTSGACNPSVENTLDVCRNPETSTLINGGTVTCAVADNRVALYATTVTTGAGTAFEPPSGGGANANGILLTAPLVVSGTSVGKFVVNPAGKICDDTNDAAADCDGGGAAVRCQMEAPSFSFVGL